jgi:RNA polymerase sigma-70 factor, ECF subfamily
MEAAVSKKSDRVSEILEGMGLSDPEQARELMELVYDDLRALAANHIRREAPGRTLRPTELVHEAYLRLASGRPQQWQGRAHFFRVAARAMRQVLVDEARRRNTVKRGGAWRRVTLDAEIVGEGTAEHNLLELHEALERLGGMDPELERLVELRFFTGLTLDEAAESLGVSRRKAANDWAAARLWLGRELAGA